MPDSLPSNAEIPSDIAQVISELGGQPSQEQNNTENTEETKTPETETEQPAAEQKETNEPDQEKSNKAFAEMRISNKKYKDFFDRVTKVSGLTEEQFINSMLQNLDAEQAKKQNTSPEIIQKLREQDERISQYEQREREKDFMNGLNILQTKFNLSQKELGDFVRDVATKGIDLMNSKLDYETLYKGIYFDKLVEKEVEKKRQEMITAQTKAEKASVPGNTTGKTDKEPIAINTMEEFNSLLANSAKK
jgi:uncharacterized protein (DUF4415 family)